MEGFGFIGFGSMGSMLVKGLIMSGKVSQEQIIVTRKDKSRLVEIKNIWPEINIEQVASEVVKKAKYVYICVKPLEYKNILDEIKMYIVPEHHIISITGLVTIESMDKIVDCKITKVMPTVISEVNDGISLICHNRKVTEEDACFIESLLGSFGKILCIHEKDFAFASELTSCGPGLYAAIFEKLIEAGSRHTDSFEQEDIFDMVLQTLYGTVRLMLEKRMSFEDVISRVAMKGGITEEGVKVLERNLSPVFDEMFEITLNKRRVVGEKIYKEFESI